MIDDIKRGQQLPKMHRMDLSLLLRALWRSVMEHAFSLCLRKGKEEKKKNPSVSRSARGSDKIAALAEERGGLLHVSLT